MDRVLSCTEPKRVCWGPQYTASLVKFPSTSAGSSRPHAGANTGGSLSPGQPDIGSEASTSARPEVEERPGSGLDKSFAARSEGAVENYHEPLNCGRTRI